MIELDFRELTHQYFVKSTGRELIAVTRVFELMGITDFSRVKYETLEPSIIRGIYVHDMAAAYGSKKLIEEGIEPEYEGYLRAIRAFYREQVKKLVFVERQVYNLTLGYAGTLDIVYFNHDDELCLDDFKTPIKLHVATKWQTAAYLDAFQKIAKFKVTNRGGVQLSRDGTYKRTRFENQRRDFNEFVTLLKSAYLKIENKIK